MSSFCRGRGPVRLKEELPETMEEKSLSNGRALGALRGPGEHSLLLLHHFTASEVKGLARVFQHTSQHLPF